MEEVVTFSESIDIQSRNITIYPNPTSDEIRFENPFEKGDNFIIRIVDITGKVIINKTNVTSNSHTIIISVSYLSEGLYFIQLRHEDKISYAKFHISPNL